MTTASPPESPRSARDLRILLGLADRIDPDDAGAHNNLGVLYYNKGLFEPAAVQFQRALALDPRMQVAQRNLEIVYFGTGFYERYTGELEERLRQDPEDTDARLRLARARAGAGDHEAARRELTRLWEADASDIQTLIDLALVERRAGRFDAALRWLNAALAREPDDGRLYLQLGDLYYFRGLNREAREALNRAIQLLPDSADAHHLLAFVLGDLGEAELATEAAARARQLNPALARERGNLSIDQAHPTRLDEAGDRRARPAPVKDRYLARYHVAAAFRQQGMYDDAVRELEHARAAGEDAPLVLQAMAELRLLRGESVLAEGVYRELLRRDEGSPKLWNELGVALHQRGDAAGAEECYRAALRRDPRYALAWNNLAVARLHQGDRVGLAEALARAVELHPTFADGWCNLGLSAAETGRPHEALRAYRSAAKSQPLAAAAWVGAGRMLAELHELEGARNALVRAVELAPEAAEARYHLGFVLSRLGDYDAALRETTRALAISPYFTPARYRLAIDLQFEYAEVLAPDLDPTSLVETGSPVGGFAFESGALDPLFAEVDPREREPGAGADASLDDARAAFSRGMLDRAMERVRRAAAAGADPIEAALLAGEIFTSQGLPGEALERFDSALARIEGRPWTDLHLRAHLGRGRALLLLGRPEAALADATTLRAQLGDRPEVLRLLGEVHLGNGSASAAMSVFERLAAQLPGDAVVLRQLGGAARAAGEDGTAESALRRAVVADPDHVGARVDLALLLLDRGASDEAAREAAAALEVMPGYPPALMTRARAEWRLGNRREAVASLVELLDADAYDERALVLLGRILGEAGRLQDARISLLRALRLFPESQAALMEIGRLSAGAGDRRAALGHWKSLIELNPHTGLAREARAELERARQDGAFSIEPAREAMAGA